MATLEERFWERVNKNGPLPAHRPDLGPCWLWTGGKRKGYGRFALTHSQEVQAHRFSYELVHGPVGSQLDHLCHTSGMNTPVIISIHILLANVDAKPAARNSLAKDIPRAARNDKENTVERRKYDDQKSTVGI
jgi:hypothetical protein